MLKSSTKAAVLAVLAGGLNLAVVAPAQAQVSVAEGRRCGFTSVTDPTIENGEVQTGQINGGPLLATAPGATISMKCTIQVGAANSTHAGADSCSASSPSSLQVTVVPPTLCSYLSPEGQPVYMCTEITINGQIWYWDNNPPGSGTWVQSSAAACAEAISQELFPGPICFLLPILHPGIPSIVDIGPDGDLYILGIWFVDCPPRDNPLPGPFFPDPILCPILQANTGRYGPIIIEPDGDVYIDLNGNNTADHPDELFWNCPPYDS